ncbi:Transcriptional regulator, LysR family [Pseudomonas chlororaphis subsp. piscium]|nr:Transcriptional regulator, LysR family [Pseudomonas chlororaphis subsp. piscium]
MQTGADKSAVRTDPRSCRVACWQVDRFLRQMHFTLREVCELDELEAIIKLVEK